MSADRRQRRAFTLLELMLALTVSAMLALSLYRSFGVCQKARQSAVAAVQPVRAATIAMDLICRDFESILPPTGLLAGAFIGTRQLGSAGDADYVEFYCLGEDGGPQRLPMDEGVRRVELGLRTDVTPHALVRRITRNLLARAQTDPEEEILCRGVRSFSLRYFDGLTWMEEWDSTALGDVLPFAIEIRLDLGDGTALLNEPSPDRILRIVPLACAKWPETTDTGTSSSGGTSGTGGTPSGSGGGR